jgi:hypothetical protein
MGLKWLLLPIALLLLGNKTHDLYKMGSKSNSRLQLLIVFRAHMTILFFIEEEILVLIKCSYRSPPIIYYVD